MVEQDHGFRWLVRKVKSHYPDAEVGGRIRKDEAKRARDGKRPRRLRLRNPGRRQTPFTERGVPLCVQPDGDRVTAAFVDDYGNRMKYRSCLYSTHGHVPESPRVRILVPLTRDVTAEEYAAVSRYVAAELGIDMFDECSYLPNQMMYWRVHRRTANTCTL